MEETKLLRCLILIIIGFYTPIQMVQASGKCAVKTVFQIPVKSDQKRYIFVSLSMPEASLKSLYEEAQRYGAILVMRGLHENSFSKTIKKLHELGITLDINPNLFEEYHITTVPTFIAIQDDQKIYRLKGNVRFSYFLEKMKEHS